MTAQVGDIYRYKGEEYKLIDRTSREFDPRKFGFSPIRWKTSCMRGFWCRYDITDGLLFLDDLTILDENGFYPELNGVACDPPKTARERVLEDLENEMAPAFFNYGRWPRHYRDVGMPLPYTGRILVGTEYVEGFYRFLGYPRPQSYKKLVELVFGAGLLLAVIDHSHTAELLREGILKRSAEGTWNSFDEDSVYKQLPEKERETLRWYWDSSYTTKIRYN